eukprot:7000580-Pyramimonas_sp.AAC.1
MNHGLKIRCLKQKIPCIKHCPEVKKHPGRDPGSSGIGAYWSPQSMGSRGQRPALRAGPLAGVLRGPRPTGLSSELS